MLVRDGTAVLAETLVDGLAEAWLTFDLLDDVIWSGRTKVRVVRRARGNVGALADEEAILSKCTYTPPPMGRMPILDQQESQ